jgi:C4-dicarboxylate transporter DctM subunit
VTGSAPLDIPPPIPWLAKIEHAGLVLVLSLMVVLPILATVLFWLGAGGLAGANVWVQNLNLILAFLGAIVAARAGQHLNLSTGELLKLDPWWQTLLSRFTTAVATAVTLMLALASWKYVQSQMVFGDKLPGGIPRWWLETFMPLGFGGTALYLWWTGNRDWIGRVITIVVVAAVAGLAFVDVGDRSWMVWIGAVLLMLAVAVGSPIYTVMGGLAMLFFWGNGEPIASVPVETVGLVQDSNYVAIPLFTLTGYILAEGGASKRLVELFRAWFGWLPGGNAAAAVMVCAFFTTFTGASGVTILALGGLLLPILIEAGYREKFAIGLLIASGSIGLLFPPSLPVILYGVVAQVPIDKLYIAGIVPGMVLVGLLVLAGMVAAAQAGVERTKFELGPALTSLRVAAWEVALPVLVLGGFFSGLVTIFEASAFTCAYAFISEVVVHKDLHIRKDIPKVFVECGTLMGGVLIILGVALGLTNFLIDAEVPKNLTAWAQDHIGGKLMFLLLLNVFLLIVGALMDIFSAIAVVVPLIIPMAAIFGVDPIHLGILFLANLELGYLTPPVGMNLFLGSYRFERPLTAVYRMAMPFLGILVFGVLVITYVPKLTTWAVGEGSVKTGADLESEIGQPVELPLGNIDINAELNAVGEPTPEPKEGALPLGTIDLEAELNAVPDPTPAPDASAEPDAEAPAPE